MSTMVFEVIEPGLLTTVQDRGRFGCQRFGVPTSGAMDGFALRAANIIVGNDQGAAGLEMTVLGPQIRFLTDTWFAVTGADLLFTLDGKPVPRWESIRAGEGSVLASEGMHDGMRGYLAFAGGIDVPLLMDSRSTYAKGGFGGFEGRPLRAGDSLGTLPLSLGSTYVQRGLPDDCEVVAYGHQHEIRVVMGPQERAFTAEGTSRLVGSEYAVTAQSDRMGYRLEGPAIRHEVGPDIVSDGSPLGAVQVPGDGSPIVLMADRGTTGGYAKVATVIGTDVGRLAQATPGDTVTFRAVSVSEAHSILREEEAILADMDPAIALASSLGRVSIEVDGEAVPVADESGALISRAASPVHPGNGRNHGVKATVQGHAFEFDVSVREGE